MSYIVFDVQDGKVVVRKTPDDDWIEYTQDVIEAIKDENLSSRDRYYIYLTDNMSEYCNSKFKSGPLPDNISLSPDMEYFIHDKENFKCKPRSFGTPLLVTYENEDYIRTVISDGVLSFRETTISFRDWMLLGFPDLYTFKSLCNTKLLNLLAVEDHKELITKTITSGDLSSLAWDYDFSNFRLTASVLAHKVGCNSIKERIISYARYGETSDLDSELFIRLFIRDTLHIQENPDNLWFKINMNEELYQKR